MRAIRVYRRGDDAVSPVIGEVLMVAIVVILAAIVYLMVSTMLTTPDEDTVSMVITNPRLEGTSRGTSPTQVWDVTMNVDAVHPTNERVGWQDLYILIKASNGSVLQPKSPLVADDPVSYDNNDTDGIDVECWYVETDATDNNVTGGDSLKITGLNPAYEGATIHLTKADSLVAKVVLPTNFD